MSGFFITGTDTDAGKTFASSALIRALANAGLSVVGLKPMASGFDLVDGQWVNSDVDALTKASNVELPSERVNRYAFKPAIAPHIAAQQSGVSLDFDLIFDDVEFAKSQADMVVVEGVGGWHVPLSAVGEKPVQDIQSLAVCLKLPVIMVVGLRLGCLNHAVLTANAIERSGLELIGWVANHIDPDFACLDENLSSLDNLINAPRLFDTPHVAKGAKEGAELDIEPVVKSAFVQSLLKGGCKA